MKTKIMSVVIPLVVWILIGVVCIPPTVRMLAAEYTGPQPVHPNFKQAKADVSVFVWYDTDAREWLRISGNPEAATLSQQWGPGAVSIESTLQPKVAQTSTGWIIIFR